MSAVCITGGIFDRLRYGHTAACSRLGTVTVALNTDSFAERYKDRPPAVSFQARDAGAATSDGSRTTAGQQ